MMRDTPSLGTYQWTWWFGGVALALESMRLPFRENEIDETVLPSLMHENLKELGVTALGHRLKLLDAIAALRANTTANAASGDATMVSSTVRQAGSPLVAVS